MKLDFGPKLPTLITSENCLIMEHFHLIEFLKRAVQCNIFRGYKFLDITELNFKKFSNKTNMKYEYYIKQPKPMVEINLNQLFARKPRLVNPLDKGVKHLLIKKHSHIPFNN